MTSFDSDPGVVIKTIENVFVVSTMFLFVSKSKIHQQQITLLGWKLINIATDNHNLKEHTKYCLDLRSFANFVNLVI